MNHLFQINITNFMNDSVVDTFTEHVVIIPAVRHHCYRLKQEMP